MAGAMTPAALGEPDERGAADLIRNPMRRGSASGQGRMRLRPLQKRLNRREDFIHVKCPLGREDNDTQTLVCERAGGEFTNDCADHRQTRRDSQTREYVRQSGRKFEFE